MKFWIKYIVIVLLGLISIQKSFAQSELDIFFVTDQEINKAINGIEIKFQNPLEDIDVNIKSFNELTQIFNQFKKINIELGNRLLKKVDAGDPLSGDDLYFLKRSINTYYKINKKMLDFAKVYNFNDKNFAYNLATPDKHLAMIKAQLIYLSGHIQVLDHIVKVHQIYYESNKVFRRIIKDSLKDKDHIGEKTLNDIIKMSEYTLDMGNNKKFASQIILARNTALDIKKILSASPEYFGLLDTLSTNDSAGDIARGKDNFDISYHNFIDSIAGIYSKVTGWLSQVFGNLAGSIKWRKGHMNHNELAINLMREHLKPMDILLEKSPFVLTDKFIPGHFGHAALYLGTKEQLLEINMWNHPDIIPYQEEIENGKVILEAIRPGVHLASLEEFSNIDEFMIIRKDHALENADFLIEGISRGMDQIGKSYDFNFDVETLDKIVCSELIYIVYGQVHWPTKYRLGRATISPDDLAEILFQYKTPFKTESFITTPKKSTFDKGSIDDLADELNFEMRSLDGSPKKEDNDSDNTYWKKTEKCYTVQTTDIDSVRQCKTKYTLEIYDETTN